MRFPFFFAEFGGEVATNQRQRLALYETIEREFVALRLPGLLADFDRGNLLTFSTLNEPGEISFPKQDFLPQLSISSSALSNGKAEIPWEQVESFEIGEDIIRIKKYNQLLDWFYCPVPDLANACLLRELAYARNLIRKAH